MKRILAVLLAGLTIGAASMARVPVADWLLTRARSARGEWKLAGAERMARWSAVLGSKAAAIEQGEVLLLQGEVRRAAATLERAAHPMRELDIRRAILLGRARFLSNEAAGAIESLDRALALSRALGDRRLEAQARIDLSRVLYYSQGRSEDARSHLTQALGIARAVRDPRLEADALRHLGVVRLWFDSDAAGASLELFEPALALYRSSGDLHGEAATLGNLALADRILGRLIDFYQRQQAAMEIAERIGDRAGQAQSLAALGGLHASTQNYRKARESFERSLAITREIGFRLGENDTEADLVGVLLATDEHESAVEHLTDLLAREPGNSLMAKYRVAALGDALLRKGDARDALPRIRESLRLDDEIGQPDHRFSFSMRIIEAEALTRLGRLGEAEAALVRAMAVGPAREQEWDAGLIPALVRAELLVAQGRRDAALQVLERAAEQDLTRLASAGSRFAELPSQRHYDRSFELLLSQEAPESGAVGLAWRFLEQLRYRSIQSVIVRTDRGSPARDPSRFVRARELTRSLLDAPADSERGGILYAALENELLRSELRPARGQAMPAGLRDLQDALDERTTLVAYVMTERRTWGITVTRDGVAAAVLPASPAEISARTRLLRTLLEDESPAERWQPVASDLHRILIAPLGIRSTSSRLVILPFAFLRDLPFAALLDANGEPLVERFAMAMATSGSSIVRDRVPLEERARRGYSFGVADLARPGLPSLPSAEREARQVARLGGGSARTGGAASEAALKRLTGPISFLHVASHAVIEPAMPLLGRLELAAGEGEDGSLTVPEILDLGLDVDLVTLSACRTSASLSTTGRPLADVDRIGLLDAFLLSGARSVLASLLPVSDRASASLMESFYELDRSLPRSEALASAQRAMRRGPYSHPRHWAPFVLFGDE